MRHAVAGRILLAGALASARLLAQAQGIPAAQPLMVTLASTSPTVGTGGSIRLLATVKDGNSAPTGPVTYAWTVSPALPDVFPNAPFIVVNPTRQAGYLVPGQLYEFSVKVTAGTRQASASAAVTVLPRDASSAWLKVNLRCDPASKSLQPGQALALTADLDPVGGGVQPDQVSYSWRVVPELPGQLPKGPEFRLTQAQTQALKAGQAYTFTVGVMIGQGVVPASCTVNVVAASPSPGPLIHPKVPLLRPRPGEKPPIAPVRPGGL